MKLGAYHTLELELQRAFTLHKDIWDALDLQRVKDACNPAASADLAAVLITVRSRGRLRRHPPCSRQADGWQIRPCAPLAQEGLANVCLVGGSVTVLRAKVEANLPRKRGAAAAGYAKALDAFFERVLQATLRHVDWDTVKCLVIAGPGFAKDRLSRVLGFGGRAARHKVRPCLAYCALQMRAHPHDKMPECGYCLLVCCRPLILNKARIIMAPASSAYKHSLKDVLAATAVASQVKVADLDIIGSLEATFVCA